LTNDLNPHVFVRIQIGKCPSEAPHSEHILNPFNSLRLSKVPGCPQIELEGVGGGTLGYIMSYLNHPRVKVTFGKLCDMPIATV
jgi:hypothetical protein